MTNKKYTFEDFLWKLLFIFGSIWLLNKILSKPIGTIGLHGIPYQRKLYAYVDRNNNRIFDKELSKFSNKEISVIITEMIITARENEELTQPLFKPLKGTKITAELRYGQFRIMLLRVSTDDYLMLSVFKKKTDNTPENEIIKAENRIKEFLNRTNR